MASAAPGATAGGAGGADVAAATAATASTTPLAPNTTAPSGAPLSAASLDASLAELATTLLPATRHAGDTLLERVYVHH